MMLAGTPLFFSLLDLVVVCVLMFSFRFLVEDFVRFNNTTNEPAGSGHLFVEFLWTAVTSAARRRFAHSKMRSYRLRPNDSPSPVGPSVGLRGELGPFALGRLGSLPDREIA